MQTIESSPNVILIMTDQQKATSLPGYGNKYVKAAGFERLCEEGVFYEDAYTPHPLCVPARCALWMSRFPHNSGCRRNETFMKEDAFHAFKFWKAKGFKTALVGKNHCFGAIDYENFFDTWLTLNHAGIDRQFSPKGIWFVPEDEVQATYSAVEEVPRDEMNLAVIVTERPEQTHTTGLVGGQAIRYIKERAEKDDGPFALWVSFPSPHEPYLVPKRYYSRFDPARVELPPFDKKSLEDAPKRMQDLYSMLNAEGREEKLREVIAAYYANVEFIDDMLSEILDTLDETGLRKNTIVVFCSDHGDFSGEHNMTIKGGVFYDCLTKVPLAISYPAGLSAGIKVESFVNLIDIVPTLLKLQGYDIPKAFHGDIMPPLVGATPKDFTVSEYGFGYPLLPDEVLVAEQEKHPHYGAIIGTLLWREAEGLRKMIRTKDYKYVHDPMGDKDELYDLLADPGELYNLAENKDYAGIIADMRLKLLDWSVATENTIEVSTDDI